MSIILLLVGFITVVVSIKLYLMFAELESDDCSHFAMTYNHLVHENDLTFVKCPHCDELWNWIELTQYYSNLNNVQIDEALSSVGLLCPDCADVYESYQTLDIPYVR